jgi:DNA-binding CsgD family transcriptional regulator
MRTAAGWVTLSATALRRASSDEVAIIVERARPSEVVDLKLDAYGLTGREQEVVRAILAGDSTAQVARRLYLSPHTVQQHLKSIFTKTGVNSRRALIALIFEERYEPSIT